jgi:hypothetical protein
MPDVEQRQRELRECVAGRYEEQLEPWKPDRG